MAGLELQVRSQVLPDLDLGGDTAGQGPSTAALLGIIRPSVTVSLNGQQLYHVAPAGEPTESYGALAVLAALVVLALAFVGARQLLKRG